MPVDTIDESKEKQPAVSYKDELDLILGRQLTPENIDTYADQALEDVIALITKITDSEDPNELGTTTRKDFETALFDKYKLGNIETILDHIAEKSNEVKYIEAVISDVPKIHEVILPPEPNSPDIKPGLTTFEKNGTVPKLKTLLFVLSNDFEIDINNSGQIQIELGAVTPEMMRRHGYYSVEVLSLNRLVLICDEENNATFVVDTDQLKTFDRSSKDLLNASKQVLDHLIDIHPGVGKKIIYSPNFIADLIQALRSALPQNQPELNVSEDTLQTYLYPKAGPDVSSIFGMAKEWGVGHPAIERAIDAIEELGDIDQYRFYSVVARGFLPYQKAAIKEKLEEFGAFSEDAPEGVLNAVGMAKEWGVSATDVVRKAINELDPDILGPVKTWRFNTRSVQGYDKRQQGIIFEYIKSKNTFTPPAPEGVESRRSYAIKLGVNKMSIDRAIESLKDELGEMVSYRFQNKIGEGITPEQQAIIYPYLESRGLFLESAPEGVMSSKAIANSIGVWNKYTDAAIHALGDQLGEPKLYRFGPTPARGFNHEEQELIKQYVKDRS